MKLLIDIESASIKGINKHIKDVTKPNKIYFSWLKAKNY